MPEQKFPPKISQRIRIPPYYVAIPWRNTVTGSSRRRYNAGMKPVPPTTKVPPPSLRNCYYRLTYSNSRADEDPQLFKGRDGIAFLELAAGLPALGYDFGTTIYLYPDDERKLTAFPAFRPSDLLVLPTRPPLHDKVGVFPRRRKVIHETKTELEAALFGVLAKYFEFCSRKHVILSKYGASRIRVKDPQKWAHIEVYEYCGAEIYRHYIGPEPVRPDAPHKSTIAFFLRANDVPGLSCDFIASFGMDGYGTLIWNRIIRQQHPEWLAQPGFVMAELIFKKRIPEAPLTPGFVDDGACVEVRLLT